MTHNTREVEEFFTQEDEFGYSVDKAASGGDLNSKEYVRELLTPKLHHQLQKAREEERERIEAVFKEHVPPHAMDLEDSVWLKRLLNKAFGHD